MRMQVASHIFIVVSTTVTRLLSFVEAAVVRDLGLLPATMVRLKRALVQNPEPSAEDVGNLSQLEVPGINLLP
jgi:hypothetical protein